jgi:hypothetical protein
MTATAKAASNGSTDTTPAPERKTGMARIREAELYHTVSVVNDAAFEAERLCNEIYRAVTGAYLRDGGTVSDAAETADDPHYRDKAHEALRCLSAAQEYLRTLIGDVPPF